jgi:hypothetical protein
MVIFKVWLNFMDRDIKVMKGFLLRNTFAAVLAAIVFTILTSYIPILVEKVDVITVYIPN